jgi:hypothetical protein
MIPLHGRHGRGALFAWAAVAAVALAVGASLYVMGSPSENRARRLDEQRVDDLREWTRAIDTFWTANAHLPSSLADVKRQQAWSYLADRDAATGQPYEYHATGTSTYQLCATFDRASRVEGERRDPIWEHDAGRACFALEARTPR